MASETTAVTPSQDDCAADAAPQQQQLPLVTEDASPKIAVDIAAPAVDVPVVAVKTVGPVIREVIREQCVSPAVSPLGADDALFVTKGLANFSGSTGASIDPTETARMEKCVLESLAHAGLGDALDTATLRLVVSNATLPLSAKNVTRLRRICKVAEVGTREWKTARALSIVNEHVVKQGNKRTVNRSLQKDPLPEKAPIVRAGQSQKAPAESKPVSGRRVRASADPAEPTPEKVWKETRQRDRRTAREHPYFKPGPAADAAPTGRMDKLKDFYTQQLARRMARMAARSAADASSSSSAESSSAGGDSSESNSTNDSQQQAQQAQQQQQQFTQPHQRQHNPYNHFQPYGLPVFNPYVYGMGYGPQMQPAASVVGRGGWRERHGKRRRASDEDERAKKPEKASHEKTAPNERVDDEDDVVERRRPPQPEPVAPQGSADKSGLFNDFSAHFLGNANIASRRT